MDAAYKIKTEGASIGSRFTKYFIVGMSRLYCALQPSVIFIINNWSDTELKRFHFLF